MIVTGLIAMRRSNESCNNSTSLNRSGLGSAPRAKWYQPALAGRTWRPSDSSGRIAMRPAKTPIPMRRKCTGKGRSHLLRFHSVCPSSLLRPSRYAIQRSRSRDCSGEGQKQRRGRPCGLLFCLGNCDSFGEQRGDEGLKTELKRGLDIASLRPVGGV